jgi:hypothetical protein
MVNRDKIEEFLIELKAKLLCNEIVFRPRDKNTQALADLEITPSQRVNYIKKLTIEDCFSGPNSNKDEPSKPDYFEFGLTIRNTEVYIKLSLNLSNKPIDCMSFHKAEKTIHYPFKNK